MAATATVRYVHEAETDASGQRSQATPLPAAFIGLFSGLQFAVSVVLDSSYRSEFAEDMTEELREALAVRAVYHRALVTETP